MLWVPGDGRRARPVVSGLPSRKRDQASVASIRAVVVTATVAVFAVPVWRSALALEVNPPLVVALETSMLKAQVFFLASPLFAQAGCRVGMPDPGLHRCGGQPRMRGHGKLRKGPPSSAEKTRQKPEIAALTRIVFAWCTAARNNIAGLAVTSAGPGRTNCSSGCGNPSPAWRRWCHPSAHPTWLTELRLSCRNR
jgi:hypothetical protein